MSKSTTTSSRRSAQSLKKWSPHTYQRKGVKFLLEHAAAALFWDPGLGKTSVTLAAFSFLKKQKVATKALVIAPLRVAHNVWPNEIAEWADFNHLKVCVLHGPKKEELLQSDADIFVINPEGLEWLIYGQGNPRKIFDLKAWRKLGFDTLIIDELTKFKHSKGVRFKALKHVLGTFARRWGLTGSPAANGLLDLFGQCYVLDEGHSLGRYISHYRAEYFLNPDNQGWSWVLKAGAAERIYERIRPLALRLAAEDYLDMPPLVDVWDMLELPPKMRRIYEDIEEALLAKVEDKRIVAANAAAVSAKLRQIANGGVYIDGDIAAIIDGRERSTLHLHDVKTEWLQDLVESLNGSPLLIAYEFKHDLERIQKAFKDIPYIGGGVSTAQAKDHIKAWNAGEYPVMAVHPASAGHGLNLQGGSAAHLAFYSLTWDFDQYDQLIRRIWRQGTKASKIFRYHAIMKGTVDETMRHALAGKNRTQQALFKALVSRR